jgi:tight adherence protein B
MTAGPGSALVAGAIVAVAVAILVTVYLALAPRARLPVERRRPVDVGRPGLLERGAATATTALDTVLRRRGGTTAAGLLEQSGLRMRVQDFAFLVVVGILAGGALGLLVGGPVLAFLVAALVPVGARVALGVLASRRRAAFADQLEDSLQLMSGSLRAGHSLLQALDSVAREAEEPTSAEFSRVINETRVGRDLAETLEETANRMQSQDFVWVTQAIAINREVGGNLAEVLDGAGATIRERNQVRRQVKALAAEGKLSAIILMALPFGIVAFLAVTNPSYVGAFTESLIGYAMIVVSVIMLVIGGLWLRKVVSFRF